MTGLDVGPESENVETIRPGEYQAMFCWGNTANGELGLGGIEEQHILAPREVGFANDNNVRTSKIKKNFCNLNSI